MQNDYGKTINNYERIDSLETVDAVARAAHLWIRSLCLNELQTDNERHAIASGLVVGLCERLARSQWSDEDCGPRARLGVGSYHLLHSIPCTQILKTSAEIR